ncbi:copper homeostasis protein CutC [Lactovum miscens]|uniref:PF03932 family protein CutC n=1 Tax=Lactovum miscens TaxID=190387 RepID=A0A841C4L3_9LACT|nr:copper homeostasis protein CutC [Lactovum miscens]MBB5887284.1 copper homeostasis protein [Lactovum miscens]
MLIREFCAENFTDIPRVAQAGVERIELCDNLAIGGTTPSYGVIAQTADYLKEYQTLLAVMIRPRSGDFVYNSHELKIMETDILKAVEAGAQTLVFGALTDDNEIDTEAMNTLVIASQGVPVTFHMAFDALKDPFSAIDLLADAGIEKILTHGSLLTKAVNTKKTAEYVNYANGRLDFIIGGGVTAENKEELAKAAGTNFVHGTKII